MSPEKVNEAFAGLKKELEEVEPPEEDPMAHFESKAPGSDIPAFQLRTANSLWARRGLGLEPDFARTVQSYYAAEISELELSDPSAVQEVNRWVNEATNQKIQRIVSDINPKAVLLLMNAVYFRGIWSQLVQFDEESTREGTFTLLDGKKKEHPMMALPQERDLPYCQTDTFQAVGLSYGKGRMSMFVFLPDVRTDLKDLLNGLTAENWKKWMSEFQEAEGMVVLPRFKFEYETRLRESLNALGMGIAFDSKNANFEKISAGFPKIWIDDITHRTFVEVNEKGTEAAAASSILTFLSAADQPFRMVVDRPFLFAIMDKRTETILFMGIVADPE